jgi:hypothetical protein
MGNSDPAEISSEKYKRVQERERGMQKAGTQRIPAGLIVLDAIGTVLVGLGLAERFAQINLVPASLQFENFDILMIGCGALFMIPMLFHVIGRARREQGQVFPFDFRKQEWVNARISALIPVRNAERGYDFADPD